MPDIPDNVIERAVDLLVKECEADLDRFGEVAVAAHWIVETVAPVIARWATEQEQNRIYNLISVRLARAAADYANDPTPTTDSTVDLLVDLANITDPDGEA